MPIPARPSPRIDYSFQRRSRLNWYLGHEVGELPQFLLPFQERRRWRELGQIQHLLPPMHPIVMQEHLHHIVSAHRDLPFWLFVHFPNNFVEVLATKW